MLHSLLLSVSQHAKCWHTTWFSLHNNTGFYGHSKKTQGEKTQNSRKKLNLKFAVFFEIIVLSLKTCFIFFKHTLWPGLVSIGSNFSMDRTRKIFRIRSFSRVPFQLMRLISINKLQEKNTPPKVGIPTTCHMKVEEGAIFSVKRSQNFIPSN